MDKIAVLIPCYNESQTIKKVVEDWKKELPEATIYVYDNNSSDNTAAIAREAGAVVRYEYQQGKGNVIRRMFREIDAECYIMIDGDDTYPAEFGREMVTKVLERNVDMVVGDRLSSTYFEENKRPFHNFGNSLVRGTINHLFKSNIRDIMTGYRVYSRRFVKNMPVMSSGFKIETEMTIFSLVYRMKLVEIPITYRDRPAGSESKLNTFSDGFKVLVKLFDLFKNYRPMLFFSCFSILFIILGLVAGIPVITEFIKTAFITKIPSAVLAASLFIIAFLLFMVGIILDAIKNQMCILFECQLNQFEYQERCKVG